MYKLDKLERPQAATSWVFPRFAPQLRAAFCGGTPIPKAAIATPLPLPHLEDKQTLLQSFPKITLFPSHARLSRVAPPALPCPQALRALPTIHPRPVHRLPHIVSAASPQTKKMRARGIAPRTRSPKKRRLLAQESTRRHAWLTRSCFGRKNLFIDGPHSLLPFFLSPFLQRKRKKKTEANSAGSNTSLGLTSFVLTMYAIGPSRLVR